MQHIGVITNDQSQIFQNSVIQGMHQALVTKQIALTIKEINKTTVDVTELLHYTHSLDGVLVIADAAPNDYLRQVYQQGIPITLVSHHLDDVSIPAVITDSREGIRLMMAYCMQACQRRHPIFLAGLSEQRDGYERLVSFHNEVLRYNLVESEYHIVQGDFSVDIATQNLKAFIAQGHPFDAVIAADYLMAIAAMKVLQSAGYRLPEDVSVVGFGDGKEAIHAGLTTVATDVESLGMFAVRQLLMQMNGHPISGTTVINVEMNIRNHNS